MLAIGSVLTSAGSIGIAALSWVAFNFFGKPILNLRDKRREARAVGERHAYFGLHSGDYELRQKIRVELLDSANSLQSYVRERSFPTRIYCWMFGYDLNYASCALLRLGGMVRGYHHDAEDRRLTLHVLFVALGATHHLLSGEIETARAEMEKWALRRKQSIF